MTLHVWTAPITYREDDALDITRVGNHPLGVHFAPSEALLWPYKKRQKQGPVSEAEWRKYALSFCEEMTMSQIDHPEAWKELLSREKVTLVCFCRTFRCHRFLVSRILGLRGAVEEGERG